MQKEVAPVVVEINLKDRRIHCYALPSIHCYQVVQFTSWNAITVFVHHECLLVEVFSGP